MPNTPRDASANYGDKSILSTPKVDVVTQQPSLIG